MCTDIMFVCVCAYASTLYTYFALNYTHSDTRSIANGVEKIRGNDIVRRGKREKQSKGKFMKINSEKQLECAHSPHLIEDHLDRIRRHTHTLIHTDEYVYMFVHICVHLKRFPCYPQMNCT